MKKRQNDNKSKPANTQPDLTADAAAAIAAGGEIVGRSEGDDQLVEGPNSK